MKLSQAISNLQSMMNLNGDIEVTYAIVTIFDIKSVEHFDNNSNVYYPYDNDELATEIIQECEKYMWDGINDNLWDHFEQNASDVVLRNKKESQEYQEYLRLKARFEPN